MMEERNTIELEFSTWLGVTIPALIVGGGAILIARSIGPHALEALLHTSLMLVFLAGGVLLGALATQALGSSQRWGLADTETPLLEESINQNEVHPENVKTGENGPASLLDDEEVDPFYEILKRNRSTKKAA